jgi:hypothetical protein
MTQIEGAVIREQGVTFAIAVVKPSLLQQPGERDRAVARFSQLFDGPPTILMAQNGRGVPTYYGRRDLVDFMATVPIEAVPWRRYTIS